MPKNKGHSRVLRQLAEEIIERIAGEFDIPEGERQDCVTSLVRQWITYDGHATLFVAGHQVDFSLAYTPLGKPYCAPSPVQPDWTPVLTGDWKISEDDLPEIFEQLNRGQSAEVTNGDGLPLRLSINPKEKRRHVEPLVKQKAPPGTPWNYHKAATVALEDRFGPVLDEEEMDALACSLARQWQKHGGVASLFVGGDVLLFVFKEESEERCGVSSKRLPGDIEPLLRSLGFAPDAIPDVIARLNLDQEIPFTDNQGRHASFGTIPGRDRSRSNGLTLNQPAHVRCFAQSAVRCWTPGRPRSGSRRAGSAAISSRCRSHENPLSPRLELGPRWRQTVLPDSARPRSHQPRPSRRGLRRSRTDRPGRVRQAQAERRCWVEPGRCCRHEHQHRPGEAGSALPGLEAMGNRQDGKSQHGDPAQPG